MKARNLFVPPAGRWTEEVTETLLQTAGFRLERIFTTGQVTPEDEWYDSPHAEWVVLLCGAARLQLDGDSRRIEMRPGDYVLIPSHCRHRVAWTDPDLPSVWLALHYEPPVDEQVKA